MAMFYLSFWISSNTFGVYCIHCRSPCKGRARTHTHHSLLVHGIFCIYTDRFVYIIYLYIMLTFMLTVYHILCLFCPWKCMGYLRFCCIFFKYIYIYILYFFLSVNSMDQTCSIRPRTNHPRTHWRITRQVYGLGYQLGMWCMWASAGVGWRGGTVQGIYIHQPISMLLHSWVCIARFWWCNVCGSLAASFRRRDVKTVKTRLRFPRRTLYGHLRSD